MREVGNLSGGSLAFATALTFFSPLQILKHLMYVLQDILALPKEGDWHMPSFVGGFDI